MNLDELTTTTEQWIRDGRAMPLPDSFSREFDRHLGKLPWLGTGLDWSNMPLSRTFSLVGARRRDLKSWIANVNVGKHTHIAIWYSRTRGGLVAPLDFAIANLDALYRHAPGIRFAFGVDFKDGILNPAYGDFLQYGSGDEIVALADQVKLDGAAT